MKGRGGFTIVELLIVIVVIGILAAITIVAFNGVQERARITSVTSGLTQHGKKIEVYKAREGVYPASLSEAEVSDTGDISYQYSNPASDEYCLTATSGSLRYFISGTSGGAQSGVCAGYNLLTWDETGAPPVNGVVADTSVYRSSPASMRIGTNMTNRMLNGSPYSGDVGQTYTVSLWVRTASNWNGTSDNSKIRFGHGTSGAILTACGYGGVKTDWTQVTCSYTLTPGNTSVGISVGNNGSVGNIWIDDLSVARS